MKDEKGFYSQMIINLVMGAQRLLDVNNASIAVELDQGENNITSLEENFNKTLALVNTVLAINPAMAEPMVIPMLETAPIKNADKFVDAIMDSKEAQSEVAQMQAELDKATQLLENQETRFGMQTDQQKLDLERMKIQLNYQADLLKIQAQRQSANNQERGQPNG
jgi:hypothetical protein